MTHHPRRFTLSPWSAGTVLLTSLSLWMLWPSWDAEAFREVIRLTARTSLMFFLLAYCAQAAWALWPGSQTHWVRQHRRQWGLLLFKSHLIHLICILAFRHHDYTTYATLVPVVTLYSGTVAYAFLGLMALSSHDRVAQWIGSRHWGRLHGWGMQYLWLSFLVANGKRVAQNPLYILPVAVLLAAIFLRLYAKQRATLPNHPADSRFFTVKRGTPCQPGESGSR